LGIKVLKNLSASEMSSNKSKGKDEQHKMLYVVWLDDNVCVCAHMRFIKMSKNLEGKA
jgi:hypothetical protein